MGTRHAPIPRRPVDHDRTNPLGQARRFGDASLSSSAEGDWGPWILDADAGVLVYHDGQADEYTISLLTCHDSARVLDWMMQVAAKTWADTVTTGGLVAAINDILHPQGNLCSAGRSTALTTEEIRREIAAAARRYPELPPDGAS